MILQIFKPAGFDNFQLMRGLEDQGVIFRTDKGGIFSILELEHKNSYVCNKTAQYIQE